MGTYTTNLELYKPTVGENGWGTLVNENFDKIDMASSITGVVQLFAGSTAPSGWLICNGQAVSRTTYAALYAVIGTTYGAGDGSTTFNLPDLQGRVPIGASSFHAIGTSGGAEEHTLTIEELPSHTHTLDDITVTSDGAHTHTVTTYTGAFDYGNKNSAGGKFTIPSAGSHTHEIIGSTSSTGSGLAHNNMQPYITLNYIIRAL